jgi:hypothetical protein
LVIVKQNQISAAVQLINASHQGSGFRPAIFRALDERADQAQLRSRMISVMVDPRTYSLLVFNFLESAAPITLVIVYARIQIPHSRYN